MGPVPGGHFDGTTFVPLADPGPDPLPEPTGFDPLTYDWDAFVGVPPGTTLTARVGSQDMTTAGQVLDARNVTYDSVDYYMQVTALDTGFTNSEIRQSMRVANDKRLTLDHCTVLPGRGNGISGPCTVRYCLIKGHPNDGIVASNLTGSGAAAPPVLIEYNKIIRDQPQVGTTHHDAIQIWSGTDITIRRNYLGGIVTTSCVIIKADVGPIDGVLLEENYFDKAVPYFHTYARTAAFGKPRNVTFRGNVFGPYASPISVETDTVFVRTEPERTNPEWIVWDANRYAADGTEVTPPNGWS